MCSDSEFGPTQSSAVLGRSRSRSRSRLTEQLALEKPCTMDSRPHLATDFGRPHQSLTTRPPLTHSLASLASLTAQWPPVSELSQAGPCCGYPGSSTRAGELHCTREWGGPDGRRRLSLSAPLVIRPPSPLSHSASPGAPQCSTTPPHHCLPHHPLNSLPALA